MKCLSCDGTGKYKENKYDTTGLITGFKGETCYVCSGTGFYEMTFTEHIRYMVVKCIEALKEKIKNA